jgi:hypothetical protein
MGHVVIDPRRLRGNFLALVESLFPEAVPLVEKDSNGRVSGARSLPS